MTPDAIDLVFKIGGAVCIALFSFGLGMFAFLYQKRIRAIDDAIRAVGIHEIQIAELARIGVASQLAKHDSEIQTMRDQLDTLSESVAEIQTSTTHIDRTVAVLAADASHTRATVDRLDRHLIEVLSKPRDTPPPGSRA